MVNNSNNIKKTNNRISPQLTEHKKDHYIWRWKSRFWLGTGIQKAAGLNWLMGSPAW